MGRLRDRLGAGAADAGSERCHGRRLRRQVGAAGRRPGAVVVLVARRDAEGCLMAEMTYLQAISDGLREEMRADGSVFCLGEDIGAFGGAFKITDGFIEEFG